MINCRVLGPVEVTVDGGPAPAELLWRKHLALLIYLARSPHGTRPRAHLVSLLWGDKPEQSARHSLNEALRVIRKLLPEGALAADGDHVVLGPASISSDLDEFASLADAGDSKQAARLIRGALMEGFAIPDSSEFEDWLSAERRIWRQHCTEVLEQIAVSHLEAGDLTSARAVAHQADETGVEDAIRLMVTLAASCKDSLSSLEQERINNHVDELAEVGMRRGDFR